MAESMSSLYRRGAISSKQMGRMSKPAILKKTKSGVPTNLEPFDGKQGKRDQGGVGRGNSGIVRTHEIDHKQNQKLGSPATASGLPSKGGQARGGTVPSDDNIDDRKMQKPDFPAGAKIKGANAKRVVGRTGGTKPSAPSQYGGPPNRKYG
jgi:hypothetical protein